MTKKTHTANSYQARAAACWFEPAMEKMEQLNEQAPQKKAL
jgi:hypothetical protein